MEERSTSQIRDENSCFPSLWISGMEKKKERALPHPFGPGRPPTQKKEQEKGKEGISPSLQKFNLSRGEKKTKLLYD